MIKFNSIYYTNKENKYLNEAMNSGSLQGNGFFDKKINDLLSEDFAFKNFFLVHSCTAALEISALLLDIKEGDEIIMPSYTYVSTANAFLLRGAKIIFVDIEEETMNIDLEQVKQAITDKTKAIVPVHYAGVSCDMDKLLEIANKNNLIVIEDAAQGIYSKYKDKYLGTIGQIGCISCHETKNITSGGEGGILFINDDSLIEKVEMIIEKGTDRVNYLNGKVDKYTWKTLGSSYSMGQLNASFLFAQLESAKLITDTRIELFNEYNKLLKKLIDDKIIDVLKIPKFNTINGHMFYIKVKDKDERDNLIEFLKIKKIETATHYQPLHLSEAGKKYTVFSGNDKITSRDAKRILRLPMHMNLKKNDIEFISKSIMEFYNYEK